MADFDAAKEAALSCFHSTNLFKNKVSYWLLMMPRDNAALADFQAKMATNFGILAQTYDQAIRDIPPELIDLLMVTSTQDKDIPLPKLATWNDPLPELAERTFGTWHEVAMECIWQLLVAPSRADHVMPTGNRVSWSPPPAWTKRLDRH